MEFFRLLIICFIYCLCVIGVFRYFYIETPEKIEYDTSTCREDLLILSPTTLTSRYEYQLLSDIYITPLPGKERIKKVVK